MSAALRVFIVDDEQPARSRLTALLSDINAELPNLVVGEAGDGAQALARLADTPADVVLADIRMPRMDGIELALHLSRLAHRPAVIFVTAYEQYAVKAFELNAIDYLLKPVRAARLALALAKARQTPQSGLEALTRLVPGGRRYLSCNERGRMLLVQVADIVYLKAELKYVTARTELREFLIEESLTQLEQEFAGHFVRVHRNCLVAREAIAGFERIHQPESDAHWNVLLRGLTERLTVSRRQWSAVKAAFAANNKN